MLAVAKVGPAHRRYFELRLLPRIVARRCPIDRSVRNFIRRKRTGRSQRECSLEQNVRFVPVELILDIHLVAFSSQAVYLHKL